MVGVNIDSTCDQVVALEVSLQQMCSIIFLLLLKIGSRADFSGQE